MNKYNVTIQATITKTYQVRAECEDEAYDIAHQVFDPYEDGTPERYEQESIRIEVATHEEG